MISVKQAYLSAKNVALSPQLKKILSFDIGYGFIFGNNDEIQIGNVCIIVDKDDPKITVLIPIIFENLSFLDTGKSIPLTIIK